jgi:hypothetical protein
MRSLQRNKVPATHTRFDRLLIENAVDQQLVSIAELIEGKENEHDETNERE